jgi:hypothetical protein
VVKEIREELTQLVPLRRESSTEAYVKLRLAQRPTEKKNIIQS